MKLGFLEGEKAMESIYKYGVCVGFGMILMTGTASGACTSAPSCSSLGYTKTASGCPNGGVKCPFDTSKWFCQESCTYTVLASTCTSTCQNVGTTFCSRGGTTYYAGCGTSKCGAGQTCSGGSCVCASEYAYTCSGTGYSSGSGTSCGGKYASCVCLSGYSWSGSSCVKINNAPQQGNCCDDAERRCGDYNYCKQYYNLPDCSAIISSCRSSGGSPSFRYCNYNDNFHNYNANYECVR